MATFLDGIDLKCFSGPGFNYRALPLKFLNGKEKYFKSEVGGIHRINFISSNVVLYIQNFMGPIKSLENGEHYGSLKMIIFKVWKVPLSGDSNSNECFRCNIQVDEHQTLKKSRRSNLKLDIFEES